MIALTIVGERLGQSEYGVRLYCICKLVLYAYGFLNFSHGKTQTIYNNDYAYLLTSRMMWLALVMMVRWRRWWQRLNIWALILPLNIFLKP